jgi:hypothetical protein
MEEQIKSDFNIHKMCRSCLMETDEELNEIFGQQDAPEAINLSQLLLQLTANIQVTKRIPFVTELLVRKLE